MPEIPDDPQSTPSLDLLSDPTRFWRAAQELSELQPPPAAEVPSALERLGPSPFPRSKFPFLGFLATVYDHVATCMDQKNRK